MMSGSEMENKDGARYVDWVQLVVMFYVLYCCVRLWLLLFCCCCCFVFGCHPTAFFNVVFGACSWLSLFLVFELSFVVFHFHYTIPHSLYSVRVPI